MLTEALLIAIGIAAEAAGAGGQRPACGAMTRGLMWPLEANANARLAVELSRHGLLEICSRSSWKFRWTAPVVHISQLRKIGKTKGED